MNLHRSFTSAYNATRLFSSQVYKVAVSQEDHVLFQEVGNNGVITLNRPKALNAVNLSMVQDIHSALKDWEDNKKLVIIKGTNNEIFCAGGDVKTMFLSFSKGFGFEYCSEFVRKEYLLNYLIHTYKKPYVALIDGVTMGMGAGLSIHGKYRIATENTVFAMPETAIGLCPDVGGTYFLSRLRGKLGLFLGLTGYRLKGVDVLHAGLATHYAPSEKIEAITNVLLSENFNIDEVLEPYHPENVKLEFGMEPHINVINECFSAPTVEETIERLKEKDSEFGQNIVRLLNKMSPSTLKVAKKAIEDASEKSLAEALITEYRLMCRVLSKTSDFTEGVRAMLIDKDKNPNWCPRTLKDVSDDLVKERFEPLPSELELVLP